jgi:hypothetical protein
MPDAAICAVLAVYRFPFTVSRAFLGLATTFNP